MFRTVVILGLMIGGGVIGYVSHKAEPGVVKCANITPMGPSYSMKNVILVKCDGLP